MQDAAQVYPPLPESPSRSQASTPSPDTPRTPSRSPTPGFICSDRTADLHTRLVERGDLHFRSLEEALIADKNWGEQHPHIARAAAAYLLSHVEDANLSDIMEVISDSPRLMQGLGDPGWRGDIQLVGHENSVTGICAIAGGLVTVSADATARVWRPNTRGSWDSVVLRGHRDQLTSVCAWRDGFITAGRDSAMRIWRQLGATWESEAVTVSSYGVSQMRPFGDGVITLSRDYAVRVFTPGESGWQQETLSHNRESMTAFCTVGQMIVAATAGHLLCWEKDVNGAWVHSQIEGGHADQTIGMCAVGDGFVTINYEGAAHVWRRVDGVWQREDVRTGAGFISICPWHEGGFITSSHDGTVQLWGREGGTWQANEYPGHPQEILTVGRVGNTFASGSQDHTARIWTAYAPGLVWPLPAEVITLPQALQQGRLGAARMAWERGLRPDDALFDAAVRDPREPLAQMASWPGVDLRNSTGETLVGAALRGDLYTAAAQHILHGALCSSDDVLTALGKGPAAGEVLAALLARGLLHPKQISPFLGAGDANGCPLVMHAFALGFDDIALELMRRDFPLFPQSDAAHAADNPWVVEAARKTMRALALHDLAPALAKAPAALCSLLLPEALESRDAALIVACMRAARATRRPDEATVRKAIFDLARDGALEALTGVFRSDVEDFAFWTGLQWEKEAYDPKVASCFREAGLHPILLARYGVSAQPRLVEDSTAPRDNEQLVDWLRSHVYQRNTAMHLRTTRGALEISDYLNGDSAEHWQGSIQVEFEGEYGQDAGGLFKDWLGGLIKQIYGPESNMFVPVEDDAGLLTWHPKAYMADRTRLRIAGRLLGKALIWGLPTGVRLPDYLLAQMTGKRVELQELAQVEPALAKSWNELINTLDASTLGLSFAAADTREGQPAGAEIPLKPNGCDEPVTQENKHEYVAAYVDHVLSERNREHLEAWLRGFYDMIPANVVRLMPPAKLGKMISGETTIDCADWESHSQPSHPNSNAIRWFWDVVREDLDEPQRRHLLWLVSGATGAPFGGFTNLKPGFKIQLTHRNETLPVSHTCFNTLDLPDYATREKVKEKILLFLEADGSFFIA